MVTIEQNVIADLLDIASHTPLHADELVKCADRVSAMIAELDHCRQCLRDAAVLVNSQRDEIQQLKQPNVGGSMSKIWRECTYHVQWPNGDITEVPSLGQLLRTLASNPDTRAVRDELTRRELELVDAVVLARVMSPPPADAQVTHLSVNHTADGKCRLSLTNGSVTLCAVLAQDEANQIAGWLCSPSKGDA